MAKAKRKDGHADAAFEQPSAPDRAGQTQSTAYQQPVAPEEQAVAFGLQEASEMYGVDLGLLESQRELEADLKIEEVASDPMAFSVDGDRVGLDNIIGTAIGLREREGQFTGEVVLKVFVREKVRNQDRIAYGLIKEEYGGTRTDVQEVVEGTAFDQRERPVQCGASVGHATGPAGTVGCLGERGNKLVLLSNNHVLAKENQARKGDPIVQSAGGRMPQDWIGYLEDFVPLNFGAFNSVDCAIAWVDQNLVSPSHHRFTINPQMLEPRIKTVVKKEGRTTGSTLGIISAVNATRRNVGYSQGSAHFRNVVIVTSASPSRPFFGQPGDSGSLVVDGTSNRPVALLFAGGGYEVFANPIESVRNALQIDRFIAQF